MNTSVTDFPRKTPANAASLFDAASTLIRMREVEGIVGMKRSTIYKLMQRNDCSFPQPVKLSNSNARGAPVAWVLSEVQAWARSRIEARDQVAA
ncbi:AlpA family transcriptional regulator [Pseudomonas helmanticensis]|uniref:AlpA family transcriptional regulator n=1 Tax=Pseudomonas helmanticensis TaxID=1471381 RepID=A0A4R7UXS5_9PSED|nr:AlpA family phage regulatory protein [Pseudomonas helmanticensis]TDV40907.1 AlpA family transcriptional regulator [Pseudomonas helmanticensis]